jgi:CBS domain-containing protein
MTVEPLMSRPVRHCRPDQTLAYAASLMWEHDCGALPVCAGPDGESQVIGMLTDRDVCMAAMFRGKALHELKVADAMSRDIRVVERDDRAEDVELLMREQRIRRVPVTDERGWLIGIVSLADLARAARRAAAGQANAISERDVGHTLAAICEPGERSGDPPD